MAFARRNLRRPPDRVHQRRESSARAPGSEKSRSRASLRAGRRPLAHRSPTSYRERAAQLARWNRRRIACCLGHQLARAMGASANSARHRYSCRSRRSPIRASRQHRDWHRDGPRSIPASFSHRSPPGVAARVSRHHRRPDQIPRRARGLTDLPRVYSYSGFGAPSEEFRSGLERRSRPLCPQFV